MEKLWNNSTTAQSATSLLHCKNFTAYRRGDSRIARKGTKGENSVKILLFFRKLLETLAKSEKKEYY